MQIHRSKKMRLLEFDVKKKTNKLIFHICIDLYTE